MMIDQDYNLDYFDHLLHEINGQGHYSRRNYSNKSDFLQKFNDFLVFQFPW